MKAFPQVEGITDPHRTYAGRPYRYKTDGAAGMDLRDYFAGQAMIALLARYINGQHPLSDTVAIEAYEYADAMMKERERG